MASQTSTPLAVRRSRRRKSGVYALIATILICPSMAALLVLFATGRVRPPQGRTVQGLTVAQWADLLGDESGGARSRALNILVGLRREAAPHLGWVLANGDLEARRDAAFVLQKIGPDAQPALAQLSRALSDSDSWVRWRAAQALQAIGPAAKQAVLPLASALRDEDPRIRSMAAEALGSIGEPAILAHPALLEATKDERKRVRQAATAALKSIMRDQEE